MNYLSSFPRIFQRNENALVSAPKVLHVMLLDKFSAPMIQLLEDHFADADRHSFFLYGEPGAWPIRNQPNIIHADTLKSSRAAWRLSRLMSEANQIVVHWLGDSVACLLALQPTSILKKCHWVIWGGDLYFYHRTDSRSRALEIARKRVIREMGHLVTFIQGDVELCRQWYGAKGRFQECIGYRSNVAVLTEKAKVGGKSVRLLVGNSANPSNRHFEIFERIEAQENRDFRILCPLSYGDAAYAKKVEEAGTRLFGDRFEPRTAYMPYAEYLEMLRDVDIAIFAHPRQQAMGNTINLLGAGKKVYLRDDVTSAATLRQMGCEISSFRDFNLNPLAPIDRERNCKLIGSYFSENTLIKQWRAIFEG